MKPWWLVMLLVLAWVVPAQAERDIVYAARYYLSPASHGTSHFHLYRINPDGTGRTQLTFGDADDSAPRWSPDGRWIVFIRFTPSPEETDDSIGRGALCLLPAGGGGVKRLIDFGPNDGYEWGLPRWSPDSRTVAIDHQQTLKAGMTSGVYLIGTKTRHAKHLPGFSEFSWSPDGKRALMSGAQGGVIHDMGTGAQTALPSGVESVKWAASDMLVGLRQEAKTGNSIVCVFSGNGRKTQQITPSFPKSFPGSEEHDDPASDSADLLALPGRTQTLVYALNNHNSTVGTDYLFFTMGTSDGVLSYLTEGQFLAWSPDGAPFCTAPGRDTTFYEKRRYPLAGDFGADRTVWYAPLFVRAAVGGPMRQLTPRLSWVVGADWRGKGRIATGKE